MDSRIGKRCKSGSGSRASSMANKLNKSRFTFRPCHNNLQEENAKLKERIRNLEQLLLAKEGNFNNSLASKRSNISLPLTKVLKAESFVKPDVEKKQYTSRLKETVHMLQKEVKKVKRENFELKEEVMKLIKNNKSSQIIAKVFRTCLCNGIDIEELWYIINPNGFDTISINEFQRGIRGIDLELKEKEVNKLFLMLCQGEEVINKQQFVFQIQAMKPSTAFTFEDLRKPVERVKCVISDQNIQFLDILNQIFTKQNSSFKLVFEGLKEKIPGSDEQDIEIITRGIFGCFLTLISVEIKKTLIKIFNMY